MPYRRTMEKRTVLALILLVLELGGSASAQALPPDEQQFCSAFPSLREALRQAHSNSMGDSPLQQRQLRQAVSVAAKDSQQMAGWRKSRQSVNRWLGELHSITESTVWSQYFGVSVKLPCGDVTVGVPELDMRRRSNTGVDQMASSCARVDPYISSDASFVTKLKRLSIGQTVTFAGQFCAIPDSINDDVIYFVFSRMAFSR